MSESHEITQAVGARLDCQVVPLHPKRVQLSRSKGWRMPPNTISVARPGGWGNPFRVVRDSAIEELRGKNLACFCPLDQPCHADVLIEIANR